MQAWKAHLILLGIAVAWGSTFTMIKHTLTEMGPATFLAYRFVLASLVLAVLFPRRIKASAATWRAGFWLGASLGLGFWFQTYGLQFTTAGKSAFITGLYIVVVPFLSKVYFPEMALHARTVWGVAMAIVGLALLTLETGGDFQAGDLWTTGCTLFFALQMVLVSRDGPLFDVVALSFVQLAVVAALCLGLAFSFETPSVNLTSGAWGTILFTSIIGTVVAFALQLKVQPFTSPTIASLIFALEGVFAALIGWWWDGEQLETKELWGAFLMLAGMLLVQFPQRRKKLSIESAGEKA